MNYSAVNVASRIWRVITCRVSSQLLNSSFRSDNGTARSNATQFTTTQDPDVLGWYKDWNPHDNNGIVDRTCKFEVRLAWNISGGTLLLAAESFLDQSAVPIGAWRKAPFLLTAESIQRH